MVPKFSSYKPSELEEFSLFSSAGKRYLELIREKEIPSIYKLRHTGWLEAALANFHKKSRPKEISEHWSEIMDQIIKRVFNDFFHSDDKVLILALGKLGSKVLNLSSDIDIIILTDQVISNDLVKKTREFVRCLNAKTQYGFLTRVDLDLKPHDQPGPLVNSRQLNNHLWKSTELWERLVYTRARRICGGLESEESFFDEIQKFCFRKYIRLDLVQNLSDVLSKILNNNTEKNNIKLCSGGIRSLELLISATQLLYGGRDQNFKITNTFALFEYLLKTKIFNKEELKKVFICYQELRLLEDQLQAILDEQTHHATLQQISKIDLDFNQYFIRKFLKGLNQPTVESSDLFSKLKESGIEHPHLNGFVAFLKKNKSYLALFEAHPIIYENLLRAMTYSPQATKLVLLRPDLLDIFLLKKINFDEQDFDEDFLMKLSDFKSISQITAIGEFLTHFNLEKLLVKSSKTADFCISKIKNRVFKDESVNILKLGKWSGGELGIFSDLDFIITYNGAANLTKQSRKFINYLTHGTFHGAFYEIDLRLRPSGTTGPILTEKEKLIEFLENQAPLWLKQAYLRNLFLDSDEKVNFEIKNVTDEQKAEVYAIRMKRFIETNSKSMFIKEAFGGVMDIEFYIQTLFLDLGKMPNSFKLAEQIDELTSLGRISSIDSKLVKENYMILRKYEQFAEIGFKTSQLSSEQTDSLFKIEGSLQEGIESNGFKFLITILKESQNIIDSHHPFR